MIISSTVITIVRIYQQSGYGAQKLDLFDPLISEF